MRLSKLLRDFFAAILGLRFFVFMVSELIKPTVRRVSANAAFADQAARVKAKTFNLQNGADADTITLAAQQRQIAARLPARGVHDANRLCPAIESGHAA